MQNNNETIEEIVGNHFQIQQGEILVAIGEQDFNLNADTLIWDLLFRGLLSSKEDVQTAEQLAREDADAVLVRREIALKKKRKSTKKRQRKLKR